MFDIMHTPGLWGGVKRLTLNCADKYYLMELRDLIGFGYDLSDTQDLLKCWRMGIIFCGKHALLLTIIQVSNPGSMGPLVSLL